MHAARSATRGNLCGTLVAWMLVACGQIAPRMLDAVPPFALALRPDNPASTDLFRFADASAVESWPSSGGEFLIHFSRTGTDAVPVTDSDASGVPDFVEQVGATYDAVLSTYRDTLGFLAPLSDADVQDNGGDARFDVYLLDFDGMGDGAYRTDTCPDQRCIGYMVQENDYAGYGYSSTAKANRILASHEFFHAVQAAYDAGQGGVFSEGTAVWATETFDPTLSDFESFLSGYLDRPERSIDQPPPGPVAPFSYGSAIFFKFLSERYGVAVIRELLESTQEDYWLYALEDVLEGGFAEAMAEFASWNLFTGGLADSERGYANGAAYPDVAIATEVAPLRVELLRMFYASARYFDLPATGDVMTASLTGDTVDLRLFMTTLTGSSIGDVVEQTGAVDLDSAGATTFRVWVVNTAVEGDSHKPSLCAGAAVDCAPAQPGPAPTKKSGCQGVEPSLGLLVLLATCRRGLRRRCC